MSVAMSPILRAFYNAVPAGGAKCNVWQAGATTTPVTIYSDATLTTPITNPATADSNGEFSFYVASAYNLRCYITTSDGTLIRDIDPVYPAVANIKGTTVASATTTDIASSTGDFIDVSGTTTITALGTAAANVEKTVRFTGALTLTHNASSLILPGADNITTANGDTAIFRSLGSGNWLCVSYVRANGEAIVTRKATTLASASTVNIGAATGDFVDISGTTTITAFDTVAQGIERSVRFTGALTLTYNAASLILPGSANIATANGDTAIFRSLGSGNWLCIAYLKVNGTNLVFGSKGADIASATTTDIGAATGDYVDITGTTTITGLGTITAGVARTVRFTGALTLTYNASSLILPGAANIITVAGDTAIFRSLGSGNWLCISYITASGTPDAQALVKGSADGTKKVRISASGITTGTTRVWTAPDSDLSNWIVQRASTQTGTMATGTTTIPQDNTIPQNTEGDQYMTLSITPKNASNILEITVTIIVCTTGINNITIALFQDSTANALASAQGGRESANNIPQTMTFTHVMSAGTASATTFKVRAGIGNAATLTFNGANASSLMGGTFASSIRIKEYAA